MRECYLHSVIVLDRSRQVLQIRRTDLYNPRMNKIDRETEKWRNRFFRSLGEPLDLLQLFDFLPQVYMYVKECDGRYLKANRVVCRVVGVDDETKIIGKTDFDFFPPAIATQYVEEDQRVIASKAPLTDQMWLVPDTNGVPQVYLCNKIPLFDRSKTVIGIAGVKRPYDQTATASGGHGRLLKVVQYVTSHYGDDISVADMAEQACLSSSQLHREFSRLFGITPNRYLREVRVGVARHQLESGEMSMAQIARHCGFYDQSHFSRQFKSSTGLTPRQYHLGRSHRTA